MSQVVVETDTIKKTVLYFFAIAGIAIIGAMIGMSIVDHYIQQQVQPTIVTGAAPATAPAPTVVPIVVPASVYPTVIEFTVLSTTVAYGHYSVYTTTGQTLYLSDFYSWNSLLPRNTYTATVIGTEANGALDVSMIHLISAPPVYPVYYFYDEHYYQYDGYTVDPISYKQVHGERVIYGKPPGYTFGTGVVYINGDPVIIDNNENLR
jgi:hypothetical protein